MIRKGALVTVPNNQKRAYESEHEVYWASRVTSDCLFSGNDQENSEESVGSDRGKHVLGSDR